MQYIPVIENIEKYFDTNATIKKLAHYRFNLPKSSIRQPLICLPFTGANKYRAHANPVISDVIGDSCLNNRSDRHIFDMPILIASAKFKSQSAQEIVDERQHIIYRLIIDDPTLDGSVRWSTPPNLYLDTFFELNPVMTGAIITIRAEVLEVFEPETDFIETVDLTTVEV